MTNAVIVSTARTPLTKSWKGAFNMTHGATLGGHAVQHAVQRAGIDAAEVRRCEDAEHARGGERGTGVDALDPGMRVRRAQHLEVQQPVDRDVHRVMRLAGQDGEERETVGAAGGAVSGAAWGIRGEQSFREPGIQVRR